MFSCPFVTFHFSRILNVPKCVGSKITVGLRPGFFADTNLPPASPSFITCKVDANGVGIFEKESSLSLPMVPGVIDSFRLEFVFSVAGKKQIAAARVFEPKELVSKKGKSDILDVPFYQGFSHKALDPTIKVDVKIEVVGYGRSETLEKSTVVKKLSSSVVKGRVASGAFKTLFVAPSAAEPSTCPDEVEKISWFDFPLLCTPHENFTFGSSGRQLDIDKEYSDSFVVHNRTGETVYFQIGQKHPSPPTYELKTEPTKGILDAGKDMTIKMTLTLKCTTSPSLRVPIRVWGNKWDRAFRANIYVDVQGTISTKLDPAEIIYDDDCAMGEGTFGIVYQAKYRGLPIAAKVVKPQKDNEKRRRNFEEEVAMLQRLRHPCVVQFIGASHFDEKLIIATEFCSFGSLGALLNKDGPFWKEHGKDITMAFRIHVTLDVARALTYLHESGIIHRDVKPDNVLIYRLSVTDKNDVYVPVCKLTDFGTTRTVAKRNTKRLKQTKSCFMTAGVGSQAYFSPEVCHGAKNYDISSDVFSFAMSAYEILTDVDCVDFFEEELIRRGYNLDNEDEDLNVTEVHEDILNKNIRPSFEVGIRINPSLRAIIEHCWDTDPSCRPPMSQVSEVLEAAFCEEIDRCAKKADKTDAPAANRGFGFYDPVSICFDDEEGFVVPSKGDDELSGDYDD